MTKLLATLKAALVTLVAEAPGAIREHLNVPEIQRVALTAFLGGGAGAIVPALLSSVVTLVAPQDAALAAALVTLVFDVRRRLGQGAPAPTAR